MLLTRLVLGRSQVVADSSSLATAADSLRLALLIAVDATGALFICSTELMELARLECAEWTLQPEPFQTSAAATSIQVPCTRSARPCRDQHLCETLHKVHHRSSACVMGSVALASSTHRHNNKSNGLYSPA